MKKLRIDGNRVFLDGEEVQYLKEYKLISSTKNDGIAELTITLNVKVDQVET